MQRIIIYMNKKVRRKSTDVVEFFVDPLQDLLQLCDVIFDAEPVRNRVKGLCSKSFNEFKICHPSFMFRNARQLKARFDKHTS